jgi:hypothetical protein
MDGISVTLVEINASLKDFNGYIKDCLYPKPIIFGIKRPRFMQVKLRSKSDD